MQGNIRKNIFRFLFLILVQTLVISHISLPFNLQAFIYLLFIVLLPIETPFWLVILISFATGLSVDFSYVTLGLHSASCTLMGLSRNIYIRNFRNSQSYDSDIKGTPNMNILKGGKFFKYLAIQILCFHFCFAFLSTLSLDHFIYTCFIALGSSIICFTLCILIMSVFNSENSSK